MTFCERKKTTDQQPNPNRPICAGVASRPSLWPWLGPVALCGLLVSCGSKTETLPSPTGPQTNAAPATETVSSELIRLVGKWERSAGGYLLEIKSIGPGGQADATYFNRKFVHIFRAVAWRDKGVVNLVIELRDENYPGSIYTLKYNPQSDQLAGQYFQAATHMSFGVTFTRMK
jgi:hypothetical protein